MFCLKILSPPSPPFSTFFGCFLEVMTVVMIVEEYISDYYFFHLYPCPRYFFHN